MKINSLPLLYLTSLTSFESIEGKPVDGEDGVEQPGACRTKHDGHGTLFSDYIFPGNVENIEKCVKICEAMGDDCKGYEFGKYTGRCEIWKKRAPKYDPNVYGYVCYMKEKLVPEFDYHEYFYGYLGGECRLSDFKKGEQDKDWDWGYAENFYGCMKECAQDNDCKGAEWDDDKKACQIWKVPNLENHKKADNKACFSKIPDDNGADSDARTYQTYDQYYGYMQAACYDEYGPLYDFKFEVGDFFECLTNCTLNEQECMVVEYSTETKSCEMWSDAVETNNTKTENRVCLTKDIGHGGSRN